MLSRRRAAPARPARAAGPGLRLSRREILAGGVGAGALLALPDLGMVHPGTAGTAGAAGSAAGDSGSRYAFLYGMPTSRPYPGGFAAATLAPTSRSGSLPAAIPVATRLAAAPVLSPDQATTALVTVDTVAGGARVTLTLVDAASADIVKQGSVTITGIPDGTNILPAPVFAAGTTTIPLVLAITVPRQAGQMSKLDPRTGRLTTWPATSWRSHHALAYFDSRAGSFSGPFDLSDEPSLALSSVAANASDLFLLTTREPQPAATRPQAPPLPQLHAFPLGSGKARFSVPSLGPWPGGEPIVTLPDGDIARLVNGREVQVFSVRTGDVTQLPIAPINVVRAKPSAVTMQARPDGTVFITKPGIGRAVIADPAAAFRVKAQISFPVPAKPLGAPWSKAVLSPSGDTLYAVGSARTGGLSAYDVATGALTASYSEGHQYSGIYQLPSGNLLAVSAANPRLAYFSPALRPLGTANTSLQISAVF
jgi:hypothetical protein